MKQYKQGLVIFLTVLVLVTVFIFINGAVTKGFKVSKIQNHSMDEESFDFSTQESVKDILKKPFYYLGKGRQAYVFSSQDNQYVIKFVRDPKYRPSLWLRVCDYFHLLSKDQKKILDDQQIRLKRAKTSYRLAAEKLSSETELFCVHLGQKQKDQNIHVFDGVKWSSFDVGKTSYLIQKKGENLAEYLLKCKEEKKALLIQEAIHNFFVTLNARCDKKIKVRDAHCTMQNMAVCCGKVIEIDVGSYFEEEPFDKEYEIKRSATPFREFIQSNMPEMVEFFDSEWKKMNAQM